VERRRADDAICLHDPTLNELRKKFCFPETKNAFFDFLMKEMLQNVFNHPMEEGGKVRTVSR
jgi:hypothetical protein